MKKALVFLVVLAAVPLSAQTFPTISGLSPVQDSYTGGRTVSIRGTGFVPGTRVFFGNTEATVQAIAADEILVRTPAHRLGSTDVVVSRPDGLGVMSPGAFSYVTGLQNDIVLLPLLMNDVPGANGSRWSTRFLIANRSSSSFAISPHNLVIPPRATMENPPVLTPSGGDPNPAELIYVRRHIEDVLTLHLSGQDHSRQNETWGVEIPVVHEREYRVDDLSLVDIPTSNRFRVALRVYTVNFDAYSYRLRIFPRDDYTNALVDTTLETFATNPTDVPRRNPAIFQVLDLVSTFPQLAGHETVRVLLEPVIPAGGTVPLYWAFASVAHFDTQHLTLITPE